ncbi:MAG: hypothetical protein ABFS08_03785 [Pseudomonadota bacterium]
MKKLLYLLLGFALFNTPPLLATTPVQQIHETTDNTTQSGKKQVKEDDC